MTNNQLLQIGLHLLALLVCVKPLGWYMARVYEGKNCGLDAVIGPVERFIYRICRIQPGQEMDWKQYLSAMLMLNLLLFLSVYAVQKLQWYFPFNPAHFSALSPDLAFNIAAAFTASADWQPYSGESSISYFNQMTALTIAKFLAAGTGMSLLAAFIRGIHRHESTGLGNFWVDLVKSILYILLPLAFLFAVFFSSQGVIQNFKPYEKISLLQPAAGQTEQIIPMGPVASSLAAEQLTVNGGGYFGVGNAHPYQNPNPLTNFMEMLAMMLIPAAFCYTFGMMVGDKRQGWAILLAMLLIYIPCVYAGVRAEQAGNPAFAHLQLSSSENMEGKETRFGIVNSAMWGAAASATASGSNNAMLDSFTPIGGLVALWLIHTGEIVFGGAGSGLYGMLTVVIIAVFIAGLMIGRQPEYLGKKIDEFEMKMAAFAILIMPMLVLILTAIAVVLPAGKSAAGNPGAHGFTEILFAFTSMVNTNGGSMSGLNANTPFYNLAGGMAMMAGRYWVAIPTLALAGSLARKRKKAMDGGSLHTYTPLFVIMLVCVSLIIGALTFFPALSLGPIAEYLMMRA